MSAPTIASVRAAVQLAFADADRPPVDDIAPHDCGSCAALRAALGPYTWDSLPPTVLETFPTKLPLLSPRAYAYFLPSYICYALSHLTPDSMVTEFTVYDLALRPFKSDKDREWHRARLRFITRPQLEAMVQFLSLIESDEALRGYSGDVRASRERLLDCWDNRGDA